MCLRCSHFPQFKIQGSSGPVVNKFTLISTTFPLFAGVFFQMSEDGYLLLLMLFMAFMARRRFILASNWRSHTFKYAMSRIIDY